MINPLLAVAVTYMKHSMQAKDEAMLPDSQGITMYRDINYLKDDDPNHLMDIYCPKNGNGLYPVVIDIHGGAWIYGDKEINQRFALGYAKAGFAVVNMNYTLMPASNIKKQEQEIFAMLHYINEHAEEYQCDRQRVILSGDSAGAHLSALCYAIMKSPSLCKIYQVTPPSLNICGLVSLHGVHDLSFISDSKKYLFRQASDMLHGKRTKKSEVYHKACLLDVAKACPPVPMLLVSSEQDMLHVQSIKARKILKGLQWPIETLFVKKDSRLDHVFEVNHPDYPESIEVMQSVFAFIKRNTQ